MGIPYVEVSAKTGYNIEKLFLNAVALVIKKTMKKNFKYNYLVSLDENNASCVAQTVSTSIFKRAKSLKILVEGCTVKFAKEKVDNLFESMLKFLQSKKVFEEIPCSSISNLKYNILSHSLSFSGGNKINYNFQLFGEDDFTHIKIAIFRAQLVEKWKKR